MVAAEFKQDLPPSGGYERLNFERTMPKHIHTVRNLLIINLVGNICWVFYHRRALRRFFALQLENDTDFIGTEAALTAERDRGFLKNMRYIRDEEADLMKNIPGWVTGKYYSEPIFKTLPPETFIEPTVTEFYIHTRLKYLVEHFFVEIFYH